MEPEEGKISVWVCREEKLVSGLSRKTTCADVVKVLLEDQNLRQGASAAMLSAAPHCYCVVEKWRGFERVLPNKTKILRLWSAWGDEQENVRFVLLKNDASLPNSGPRSAEARVVLSRDGCGPVAATGAAAGAADGTARGCWSAAAAAANLSQEKQRRIVRKAFRKLDKMNKKKEEALSREQSCVEKMETLVHLVLSQDHTLRQQLQRLRQLDAEIERCEAKVHLERIKRHGANYVQDTYLAASAAGAGTEEAAEARVTAEALAQLEEYARRCEEVLRVQEELTESEALLERVTADIQEELNRRWMRRRRDHPAGERGPDEQQADAAEAADADAADAADLDSLSEDELALEEERIRTQLDTSLYIGLRLQTDAEAARTELERSAAVWESREQELRQLLAQVDTVELQGGEAEAEAEAEAEGAPSSAQSQAQAQAQASDPWAQAQAQASDPWAQAQAQAQAQGSEAWAEQVRGLSKTCSANDDDSDTGLSSMHSQDSDNPPVCESLV